MLVFLLLTSLLALGEPFSLPKRVTIGRNRGLWLASETSWSSSSLSNQAAVAPSPTPDEPGPQSHYDSIICGGGPAGLLSAIMLAQKFGPSHRIALCEQRPQRPPSPTDDQVWSDVARFYLLGIGQRGQQALNKFGVLEDFQSASVPVYGRRDWSPGQTQVDEGKTTPAKKGTVTRILARDKLVGVLYHHLIKNYIQTQKASIDLLYGYQVEPLSLGEKDFDDDELVRVRIVKCEETKPDLAGKEYVASQDSDVQCNVDLSKEVTTNFLIGADGAARTIANAMEAFDKERRTKQNMFQRIVSPKPFRVKRFVDDNPRLFKSVPIRIPSDWDPNLNYSARSTNSRITLEALPSDDKGTLCALLLIKPDDEFAQPNVDPSKMREFFNQEFPQFGALIDDAEMARLAQKPASALPAFRYAGPRLHAGSRTLVLGDAAHTVKPYYGLGCNTALEDVEILSEVLDQVAEENRNAAAGKDTSAPDLTLRAAPLFSQRRADDARALVTISRNMDRPGKLFLVTFLIPIILDGIFHKLAPRIFGPNMFGMFQRQDIGFKQMQRKKRLDRVLQLSILGSALAGVCAGVRWMIVQLAKVLGKSPQIVTLGLVATMTVGNLLRKLLLSKRSVHSAKA